MKKTTLFLLASSLTSSLMAEDVTNWVSVFDPQSNTPRFTAGSELTNSPISADADQDSIAANFSAITLADGDSLTLTGSVSFAGIGSMAHNQFRIGLFNGATVTEDSGSGYTGFFAGAPSGASAYSVFYGNGTNANHPFGTSASESTTVGAIAAPNATVGANTALDFQFVLSRSGSDFDINTSFTSVGYSAVSNLTGVNVAGMGFEYNTVAFLFGGSFNGTEATFSDIDVSHTTAIPEPSTYAALFGALALGIVMIRRRR